MTPSMLYLTQTKARSPIAEVFVPVVGDAPISGHEALGDDDTLAHNADSSSS